MTHYFFDRCISQNIVEALKCLDVPATHHDEMFDSRTPDVGWIPTVGANGWHLITCDDRIRKRVAEKQVLDEARIVAVFIFNEYPKLLRWDQFVWMVKSWPRIETAVKKAKPGTALYAKSGGKIEEIT